MRFLVNRVQAYVIIRRKARNRMVPSFLWLRGAQVAMFKLRVPRPLLKMAAYNIGKQRRPRTDPIIGLTQGLCC